METPQGFGANSRANAPGPRETRERETRWCRAHIDRTAHRCRRQAAAHRAFEDSVYRPDSFAYFLDQRARRLDFEEDERCFPRRSSSLLPTSSAAGSQTSSALRDLPSSSLPS